MHVFLFFKQTRLHMLCVKSVSALCTAQQAAKVHPSNRAGFPYPSVSQGVQDKELTLGSRPPGSSVCVCMCVYYSVSGLCVSFFVCVYVHLPVPLTEE